MKDRASIILLCFIWCGVVTSAEFFDPFSLINIHHPIGYIWNYCAINLDGIRTINYDCKYQSLIKKIIDEARLQRKKIKLDVENPNAKTIKEKISVSEVPLRFDHLEVDTESIIPCKQLSSDRDLYFCYSIKGEEQKYDIWLTLKQMVWLNTLYDRKISRVMLNLSVLASPSTHGKFFLPKEVILPVYGIN